MDFLIVGFVLGMLAVGMFKLVRDTLRERAKAAETNLEIKIRETARDLIRHTPAINNLLPLAWPERVEALRTFAEKEIERSKASARTNHIKEHVKLFRKKKK